MSVKAYPLQEHRHDVVIVGAGGAGLRAAVSCAENGLSTAVISKVPPTRSHTVAAQGGINAALGNKTPDDWRWHMYDTIRGSDWLGDQDSIAFMCKHAAEAVRELEHMGVPFTRDEHGKIYQRAYGGQSTDYGKGPIAYRACAVADRTGHAMLHTLYGQAIKREVKFFIEYVALDLLMDEEGACRGILAWELETGTLHAFRAHVTMIATGGYGQAYAATTASSICTGDGNAMALRAGLPLQDMEFIQFHPTGLYGTGLLITEGARGEGGVLENALGERFMERYAPKYRDLASRDIVCRAMVKEIMEGRGCGPKQDHLYLRLTHLDSAILEQKLPAICDIARTFAGVDPRREPIPVSPAVHYTMGGIPTNYKSEVIAANEARVEGLMALGEAACNSVHGANRLGCNSLLDLVVFGKAAGINAREYIGRTRYHKKLSPDVTEKALANFHRLRSSKGSVKASDIRHYTQQTMQQHASILRHQASLKEGLSKIMQLWEAMQSDLGVHDTSLLWNNELLAAIEADNLLRQAVVTLAAAHARTESRGAHWREDHPRRNDKAWFRHSLTWLDEEGRVALDSRAVRLQPLEATAPQIMPEDRVY